MAEMRLAVAGAGGRGGAPLGPVVCGQHGLWGGGGVESAGGRMGRTLVKAIADSKGFALAGALEDARSPLIGWDAGVLAGLGENGIKLTGDAGPLLDKADGIIDFTAPAATLA